MDYGSILWFKRPGSITLTKQFDKIQNRALVTITGAFYQAPRKALEVESVIPPSSVRHFKHANLYALRILRLQKLHPISKYLYSPLEDELSLQNQPDPRILQETPENRAQITRVGRLLISLTMKHRIEVSNNKWIPPWLSTNLNITISCSSKSEAANEHSTLLTQIPDYATIIYTDGSFTEGKGSSIGFIIYPPSLGPVKCCSFNLGQQIGITDAETYCILKAIKTAKKLTKSSLIYVFSDSQTSLRRIKSNSSLFCHQIRKEGAGSNIKLIWCPGHMKIEGNELADSLARGATKKPPSKPNLYTSFSFLKHQMKLEVENAWCKDWTTQLIRSEEGRRAKGLGKFYSAQAKCSVPQFNSKVFDFNKYSRQTQSAYFQARTGIGNNLAYLNKIGKSETNICNFCKHSIQTTQHLILNCPAFKHQRRKEFKGIIPLILPVIFNTLIGKHALLRYLSTTKCLTRGQGSDGYKEHT